MEQVHEAQVDVAVIDVVRDLFSDDPDNDVWDVYNRTEPSVQPYLEECMFPQCNRADAASQTGVLLRVRCPLGYR